MCGAVGLPTGQGSAEFLDIEGANGYVGKMAQILPGLNAIENFEDQDAKQHILGCVSVKVFIDDILDQILAHTVASAVDVGKLIFAQNWVVGKRSAILAPPPEDVHPLLNEVEVVFQRSIVGYYATRLFSPHKYLNSGG